MMTRPSKSQEFLLLFFWVLLAGPLIASWSISLIQSPTADASTELGRIILSSIISFALPSLFLPSGKKARQWLFKAKLQPSRFRYPRLRLLAIALGGLLLAEGSYLLSVYLGAKLGYQGGDLITERVRPLLAQGEVSMLFAWIALALVPACTEEILFRGMVQPLLTDLLPPKYRKQTPLLITALLFSLLHFSPIGFVSRFALGYALSLLAHDTRGLRIPILLHLSNNTLALLTLYP